MVNMVLFNAASGSDWIPAHLLRKVPTAFAGMEIVGYKREGLLFLSYFLDDIL
jgi:hypothetical protein